MSKTTGEQFHEPFSLGEAAVKALGFQPAEEARQWEAKGERHAVAAGGEAQGRAAQPDAALGA